MTGEISKSRGGITTRGLKAPPLRQIGEQDVAPQDADIGKLREYVPLWDFPSLSYDLSGGKTKFFDQSGRALIISRASKVYIANPNRAVSFPRRIDQLVIADASDDRLIYLASREKQLGFLDIHTGRLAIFAVDVPVFTTAISEDTFLAGMRESPDSGGVLLCTHTMGEFRWATQFTGMVNTVMGLAPVQPYHIIIADEGLFFVASWDYVLRIDCEQVSIKLLTTERFWNRPDFDMPFFGNYMAHSPIDCLAYERTSRRLFMSDQSSTISCWTSKGEVLWHTNFGYYGSRFCLFEDKGLWAWGNRPGGGFLAYFTQEGKQVVSLPFPNKAVGNGAVATDGALVFSDHSRSGAWRATVSGSIEQVFAVKK